MLAPQIISSPREISYSGNKILFTIRSAAFPALSFDQRVVLRLYTKGSAEYKEMSLPYSGNDIEFDISTFFSNMEYPLSISEYTQSTGRSNVFTEYRVVSLCTYILNSQKRESNTSSSSVRYVLKGGFNEAEYIYLKNNTVLPSLVKTISRDSIINKYILTNKDVRIEFGWEEDNTWKKSFYNINNSYDDQISLISVNVSPSVLPSRPDRYRVSVYLDNKLINTNSYTIKDYLQKQLFLFAASQGGYECFIATGEEENELQIKRKLQQKRNLYSSKRALFNPNHKLNSGYKNISELKHSYNFVNSDKIYMYKGGKLTDINITQAQIKDSSKENFFSFDFTYQTNIKSKHLSIKEENKNLFFADDTLIKLGNNKILSYK
jgi:hypothetical protein